ncbi:MAG: hypothetical protein IT426_06590 [Pirellulales bacterium]|nr:hypothetical protein [Pirellulales bacterium]
MARRDQRSSKAERAKTAKTANDSAVSGGNPIAPFSIAGTAALGMLAAWLAAGSTGLLGYPLARGSALIVLAGAVLAVLPKSGWTAEKIASLLFALALAAAMIAWRLPIVGIAGTIIGLAVLAWLQPPPRRTALLLAAEAVFLLAIYRTACLSQPLVWQSADAVGGFCGRAIGAAVGQPLSIGATFAGLDFLLPMIYLALAAPLRFARLCPRLSPSGTSADKVADNPVPPARNRCGAIALALAAVVGGYVLYLVLLAFAPEILSRLPEIAASGEAVAASPEPNTIYQFLRDAMPWNLPLVGAAIQCLIAGMLLFIFQRRLLQAGGIPFQNARENRTRPLLAILSAAGMLCALLLPVATVLCLQRPALEGKKIVLYEKGFLNWLKPEHGEYGRLSIGMYGMLPTFVESLGSRCLVSPDLSEKDLEDADVLVLIYPNKEWTAPQKKRIWEFVRRGGSLLVMGEHTVQEKELRGKGLGYDNRVNEILEPTAIRLNFDSAMFAVGGWLQSYEALAHPATAGVGDEQNDFGAVIGAALSVRPPARPVLVGRYGWSDPGDENKGESMMGNHRYDPGERLGDLVLAAEQPLGRGKVFVFGDTSTLTNGVMLGCHPFVARLLTYLADGDNAPRDAWRQILGAFLALGAIAAAIASPRPWLLAGMALALAASLAICVDLTHRAGTVLPDGRFKQPNNLAYIDAAQMGAYSRESLRDDGTLGLSMTLMRNGYLTLMLPELTPERLERARLLVSIAPLREYTASERKTIIDFIERGGIFICTVGLDAAGPSKKLLDELGFQVGASRKQLLEDPQFEPKPLGHFKSPYFNGGNYYRYVRFHAAWPVWHDDLDLPKEDPLARARAYAPPEIPVIITRKLGKGSATVIGDTCFAMNVNLERIDGSPFEGLRENADFWRWLLPVLCGGERWDPPNVEKKPEDQETEGRTP